MQQVLFLSFLIIAIAVLAERIFVTSDLNVHIALDPLPTSQLKLKIYPSASLQTCLLL